MKYSSHTFWSGCQRARLAASWIRDIELESVGLRLHMAGMPVVVAVVLYAKIAWEDFHEGRPRPHEVGIYQPSPMHAHLEVPTFKTKYKLIYIALSAIQGRLRLSSKQR